MQGVTEAADTKRKFGTVVPGIDIGRSSRLACATIMPLLPARLNQIVASSMTEVPNFARTCAARGFAIEECTEVAKQDVRRDIAVSRLSTLTTLP